MPMWEVFVPGIGILIVRAPDTQAAAAAATEAGRNLGAAGDVVPQVRNTLDQNQVQNFAGAFLVNNAGGVVSQVTPGQNNFEEVLQQFSTGALDNQQNQVEEQGSGNPLPVGQEGPTDPNAGTTVTQPGGAASGVPAGFNPAEGIGASSFAPFALTEALKAQGLDTSRPGQGFFASLFPEVQAAEALGSIFGSNNTPGGLPGGTQSPFANFVQGTLGSGGAQALGQQAQGTLAQLAGQGANRQITEEEALALGLPTTGEGSAVGNPYGQIFNLPQSLDSQAARAVQNLASGALLSKISPSAFGLFGNQLVNQATSNFGQQTASGAPLTNFSQFLRTGLGV